MDEVRSATVQLSAGFWRDVQWWRDHIGERYSVPWEMPEEAEAVLSGTDASGWGTGQLAWIDGAREEIVLQFTRAEQRRPINWRELLGIVRVVETFGVRLEGRLLLIETDTMAAKGGRLSPVLEGGGHAGARAPARRRVRASRHPAQAQAQPGK
eukprot:1540854-Prymnesium_polylepis.2